MSASCRSTATCSARFSDEGGATLVEWVLGASTLFLILAITIEFAHWQTTRHIAAIALMEAARAGSVQHAEPEAIKRAFLSNMKPRFTGASDSSRSMAQSFERMRARSGMPAWQILQLAPDNAAFSHAPRHDGRGMARARGKRILRHDLNERDGQVRHLGSRTNQTAVNSRANAPALTLHLRLTYHQPALFVSLRPIPS